MARGAKKAAVEAGPVDGLWDLPGGWEWRRLREIAEIVGGGTPRNAVDPANFAQDGVPWITPADLSGYDRPTIRRGARSLSEFGFKNSAARRLPTGTVLVSSRAPVGYCSVAEGPITTNQGFKSLVLQPSIDPFYVRYYILRSRQYLQDNASGTTFKELSGAAMGELLLPLPPIEIQRCIVSRIDKLFGELEEGEAALTAANEGAAAYRKSVLKAAVSGELTSDWRTSNRIEETGAQLLDRALRLRRDHHLSGGRRVGASPREPQEALLADLPQLPTNWAWATLEQLSSLITSGSRGWADYYSAEGPIFIRAANLNRDRLDLTDVAHVSPPGGAEGSRTSVKSGDVLVTITGANVTKAGRVEVELDEAYVSQHVGLVRPIIPELSDYLYKWVIAYGGGRGYLEAAAYGAGKPGLSLENLRALPVALPPLSEIRALLGCADRLAEAVEDFRKPDLSPLRQSILAAAFRGDLVA